MKAFLILFFLLASLTLCAADYETAAGTAVKTHVKIPQAKTGGGEFYTVSVKPEEGVHASEDNGSLILNFDRAGEYSLKISVNKIIKSSCGGVEVIEILSENITANAR
ncbi:MAG: hypothetical protein AB7E48_06160 [Deferribacterales bacterium]